MPSETPKKCELWCGRKVYSRHHLAGDMTKITQQFCSPRCALADAPINPWKAGDVVQNAATPSPETGTAAVPMTEKPPHKWFPEPGVGWKCGHCFALRRVHGCGENEPGMDYRLRGGRTWLEYEPDCIGTFAAVPAPEPVKPPEALEEFVLECVGGRHRFDCKKYALHCSSCGRVGHGAPKCPARTPAAGTAPTHERPPARPNEDGECQRCGTPWTDDELKYFRPHGCQGDPANHIQDRRGTRP